MTARELAGLLCLVSCAVLIPLGWIINNQILVIGMLLGGTGAWLFYTERMLKKAAELDKESSAGANGGPHVPSDLHNYTGWRTGGRKSPAESGMSEDAADGD